MPSLDAAFLLEMCRVGTGARVSVAGEEKYCICIIHTDGSHLFKRTTSWLVLYEA